MTLQDRKYLAREVILKIVDKDTFIKSNVNGSTENGEKKATLDPAKVAFINKKTFGKGNDDTGE